MFKSIGPYVEVTTAGTPVRVTANASVPTARVVCHGLFIQQIESNTGKLYLMDRPTASKTTGVGVLLTIAAPTLNTGNTGVILPWALYSVPYAPGAVDASIYWLDADVSGNKACVSIVVA